MAVYVDDVRLPFGRMIMCHMWADSDEELHAMADRIGVARQWFQQPPKASWKHYDIAMSKKALALKAGAILTDRYGPVEHVARLRGDEEKLRMIAALREREKAKGGLIVSRQKPPLDTVEKLRAALTADRYMTGHQACFAGGVQVRRQRVLKGETLEQARERWAREEQLERELMNDPRRQGGRIHPVRYDEE